MCARNIKSVTGRLFTITGNLIRKRKEINERVEIWEGLRDLNLRTQLMILHAAGLRTVTLLVNTTLIVI